MYNKSVNMDFNWSKLLKEAPFSAFTKWCAPRQEDNKK